MDIPVRFNDGMTAINHEARLRLDPGCLVITGNDGARLARWQLIQLEVVDGDPRSPPLRLSITENDGAPSPARLIIEDGSACQELLSQVPDLARRRRLRAPRLGQALLYGGVTALILAILYFGYPRLVEVAARMVPVSWEERVGEATAGQIADLLSKGRDGPRFCTGAAGTAALGRLTERLAAKTQSPFRFRVRILPARQVNALAAPGGHILILRGLIKEAEGPDELAGVLAHEIGHVVERHATRSLLRQMGLSTLFTILFGNQSVLPGIGETLIGLSFNRETEAEADRFALELLAAAGIRPDGFRRFFERLAKKHAAMPDFLTYLSTHPASGARANRAGSEGKGDAGMSEKDWADIGKICAG